MKGLLYKEFLRSRYFILFGIVMGIISGIGFGNYTGLIYYTFYVLFRYLDDSKYLWES